MIKIIVQARMGSSRLPGKMMMPIIDQKGALELMLERIAKLELDQTYNLIVEKYNSMENIYDSLNTVSDEKQFLYLKGKPLNFDPEVAPNSQDLPDIVKLNFAANVITKKLMSHKKSVIGDKPLFHKLDEIESVDIDTILDFEFAEFLHKKYF